MSFRVAVTSVVLPDSNAEKRQCHDGIDIGDSFTKTLTCMDIPGKDFYPIRKGNLRFRAQRHATAWLPLLNLQTSLPSQRSRRLLSLTLSTSVSPSCDPRCARTKSLINHLDDSVWQTASITSRGRSARSGWSLPWRAAYWEAGLVKARFYPAKPFTMAVTDMLRATVVIGNRTSTAAWDALTFPVQVSSPREAQFVKAAIC